MGTGAELSFPRMSRSTCALRIVSSFLHFSFECTSSCCCTIMPGRISRWTMRTSFGQRPQPAHLPSLRPAHLRQTTRRVIAPPLVLLDALLDALEAARVVQDALVLVAQDLVG